MASYALLPSGKLTTTTFSRESPSSAVVPSLLDWVTWEPRSPRLGSSRPQSCGSWCGSLCEGPVQRVVCDLLPAMLPDREVRAAGEFLVLGDCVGLGIALCHRLVDHGGHRVV